MMRLILLGAGAFMLAGCAKNEAAPAPDAFGCPAELETDETSGGNPVSSRFRYVSFFDGDPAEMVNLAPEEGGGPALDQVWRFDAKRERPIVMVCRYHGTERTIEKQVPASVSECSLKGEISDAGEIVGSPALTCR
jgi:hypothetical protein